MRLKRTEGFAESYLESLDTSVVGIPSFDLDFEPDLPGEPDLPNEPDQPDAEVNEPELHESEQEPEPSEPAIEFELESESPEPAELKEPLKPKPLKPLLKPKPKHVQLKPAAHKPRPLQQLRPLPLQPLQPAPKRTRIAPSAPSARTKLMIPRLIKADNTKQPVITIAFNQNQPVQLPPNNLDMDALWLAHWQQFEQNRTRL